MSLSKDDFHERVTDAIVMMEECLAVRTVRSCVYDTNLTTPIVPVSVYDTFEHTCDINAAATMAISCFGRVSSFIKRLVLFLDALRGCADVLG